LYNQLDDLVVDSPNARKVVAEHAQRAADFGFLNEAVSDRSTDLTRIFVRPPHSINTNMWVLRCF
jgi:hypothetical protein